MDFRNRSKELIEKIKQYKYVALTIGIGLIFMLIPFSPGEKSTEAERIESFPEQTVEERLAEILSRVKGAGNVEVLLTCSAGEEYVYQTNSDKSDNSMKIETVIITDAGRAENGLICQVKSQVYRGAIVVCQGADDPTVKLLLVDAVSKVTGLGTDKISVLKMK